MPSGIYPHKIGWYHSEETKRKIGFAHKGKKVSKETREKISKANKGCIKPKNSYSFPKGHTINVGKKASKETKKKMSLARKGKKRPPFSKEWKVNIRKARAKQIMPSGKNHHWWKSGRTKNNNGYILIYKPDHPFAYGNGYVLEHRLVMEQHLKRYLKPKEVVHHINEIRDDNRLENLMLFPNENAHRFFHRSYVKKTRR